MAPKPDPKLIKQNKDALISALFSLSKSAQETANATIDFYQALSGYKNELPSHLLGLASDASAVALDIKKSVGSATSETPSTPAPVNGGSEVIADVPSSPTPAETTPKPAKRVVKKRKVDPNAPRKPVTSFFLFGADERQKIREEREESGQPPLNNNDMTTELAARWGALGQKGQDPWKAKYQENLEKYRADKMDYETKKTLDEASEEALASAVGDAGVEGHDEGEADEVPEPVIVSPVAKKAEPKKRSKKADTEPKKASPTKRKAPEPAPVPEPPAPAVEEPAVPQVPSPVEDEQPIKKKHKSDDASKKEKKEKRKSKKNKAPKE